MFFKALLFNFCHVILATSAYIMCQHSLPHHHIDEKSIVLLIDLPDYHKQPTGESISTIFDNNGFVLHYSSSKIGF